MPLVVGGARSGLATGAAGGVIRPLAAGGVPPRESLATPVSGTVPAVPGPFAGTAATASSAKATLTRTSVPNTVTGLTAWYDAADPSTITASGGSVSAWADRSGGGLDVAQATGANQPTTGAHTLNGKNVITYDASNDWIAKTSGVSIAQAFTLFVVFQLATTTNARRDIFNGSNIGVFPCLSGNARWCLYSNAILETGTAIDTSPHVHTCRFTGASATSEYRLDGTVIGTDSFVGGGGWSAITVTNIGVGGVDTSGPVNGDIAELLVYSGDLSSTDRATIEAYLKTKWIPPVLKDLAGTAATSSSSKATTVVRAAAVTAKAATSSSTKASARAARPITAKAATSSSTTAPLIRRARHVVAKAATSASAKARLDTKRAELASHVSSSASAKASSTRVARPLTAKAASSSSAKASERAARPLGTKAATSSSAKASLDVALPGGGPKPLAGKAATSASAKASAIRRAAGLTAKAASSSSAKATVVRARRLTAKAASTSSVTAPALRRARPFTAKAASSSGVRASLTAGIVVTGPPLTLTVTELGHTATAGELGDHIAGVTDLGHTTTVLEAGHTAAYADDALVTV